ncbi:MAG: hypothetical protein ACRDHP_07655, partial [Ktedonobacterales bacterium]
MPRHTDTNPPRRLPVRAIMLAIACGWLLLTLSVLVSPAVFAFGPAQSASAPAISSPTHTATPTDTPPQSTPTPTPTATVAGTTTPSTTPSVSPPTATATTAPAGGGGGGGGNGGGGGGPAGPNVTRVVFSQPTFGANDNSPLQGLTPSAFGSNGLLLASTLSCVVALLGVIIAAIALLVLVRGGYGPYLKALLRGKRAGRKRGKGGEQAESAATPAWNASQNARPAAAGNYPGQGGYAPGGQGYRDDF